MNESVQRKSGAILSYVSIIVSTLVQLLYTPFLTGMLGQSEYGLYSLIASVIGYLTVLDLGFGNAIIVYTAKYRANNEYEKEKKMQGMFKIIFYIIGALIALIGVGLYFSVDTFFGKTMTDVELEKAKIMMLILAFNMVITFAFNIYSSIINAYERFTFQKVMSILNTILKPVLMIPLLFLGFKSITMCLVITFVNILVVLSNYIYCKKKMNVTVKFQGFDKVLFIEMFSYSFFIFLGVVVDKINWSVDQFILGIVSGTVAVSIYSVASQLNHLFVNLSTAISGVLLPKMSQMVAKQASASELTDEMIKVGRIQWLIIFLMASGFVLVGQEFIAFWVGNEYRESYYVALLLILPVCIPLIQNLAISIMQAMNKHKFRATVTSIMAIINIALSYFLAKSYGVIGTAVGTAISLIACNVIIMNIYYSKALKLEIKRFWKNIIKMSVPFCIPLVLIVIFMHFINLSGIVAVIIYGSLYTLMYSLTAYYLSMNEYEKNLVNKVLNKLHIKA
ncbi:MAG: oligosaccharide flippase family protein [Clostridia bacterium]|nr:oligosaccharide flippase family protein [Clostridia bacterium]